MTSEAGLAYTNTGREGKNLQQVIVLVPQRGAQRQHRVAGAPMGLRHLLLLVCAGHS